MFLKKIGIITLYILIYLAFEFMLKTENKMFLSFGGRKSKG